MQAILDMDTLNKKQCVALRRALQDAYKIIAQGANDTINVRHDVAEVQDEQRRRKRLLCKKPSGQQLITDWLGHKRKRMTTNDGGDTTANGDEYGDDDKQEYTWIPPLSLRTREELK